MRVYLTLSQNLTYYWIPVVNKRYSTNSRYHYVY